jgi:hypothetical protein
MCHVDWKCEILTENRLHCLGCIGKIKSARGQESKCLFPTGFRLPAEPFLKCSLATLHFTVLSLDPETGDILSIDVVRCQFTHDLKATLTLMDPRPNEHLGKPVIGLQTLFHQAI